MKRDIPAPGFSKVSGKQGPRGGESYWVQFRCGWCDLLMPYPAKGPRWRWEWIDAKRFKPDDWDIVAVRAV